VLELAKLPSFSLSVAKVIRAPLPFVYAWCTDFREDDHKITGERKKISVLEKRKTRYIISVRDDKGRSPSYAAKIVTLQPPNAWHLDWIGDEDDENADYRLSRVRHGTRLNVRFNVKSKVRNAANKVEWKRHANYVWDKYVAALEHDFSKGRRSARR
jgi:hypothetical protein